MVAPLPLLALLVLQSSPADEPQLGRYRRTLDDVPAPVDASWGPGGALWVLAGGSGELLRFDESGARTVAWRAEPSARPSAFTRDGDGRIWIADPAHGRVARLGADGAFEIELSVARDPVDLAWSDGRLAIADALEHRVLVVDERGAVELVVGGHGRAPGRLVRPSGVAFDARGRLWVADTSNHRVQVFERDGALAFGFGDYGHQPGLFAEPCAVLVRGERVWVADRENHRVQELDLAGGALHAWGRHALRPREGEGALHYPAALALDPSGERALVCEPLQDRCQLFDRASDPTEIARADPVLGIGPAAHFGPPIAADGALAMMLEPETRSVVVHDLDETPPVTIARFGGYATEAEGLLDPVDVAWDAELGLLAVVDRARRGVQLFAIDHDPDEELRYRPRLARLARSLDLVARFGERRGAVEPSAACWMDAGRLALLDERGRRVLVLDDELELERVLGSDDVLARAVDLAYDAERATLVVLDAGARAIVRFGRDGAVAGVRSLDDALGDERRSRPAARALAPDGTVLVTDAGTHELVRVRGDEVTRSGSPGLGAGEYYKPRGVAVDARGRTLVVDHGNHRVQILAPDGTFELAFGSRLYVRATRPK